MDHEVFCHVTGDEDVARQFLRANNLLIDSPACPNIPCQAINVRMSWNKHRSDRPSQFVWRCSNCRRTMSERTGSIFECSKLPLTKCLALIHYWGHNLSVKATVGLLQITKSKVIQWHKRFRSVCTWYLEENPRQIGGRVMVNGQRRRLIVEIDEALVAKRKNNQ